MDRDALMESEAGRKLLARPERDRALIADWLREPAGGWPATAQAWHAYESYAQAPLLTPEEILEAARVGGLPMHPNRRQDLR